MASSAWQKKLQEAQDLANKGAKCEISKDYSTAFQCYVRAGETYLWLVREAIGPRDTTRLRAAAEKVLSRAETIKRVKSDVQNVPRRLLSDEEQARALEVGSRVDSSKLLEWSQNCCSAPVLHTQRPLPALAPKQISQNALYQKMSELSPSVSNLLYDRKRPIRGSQIAQRVVTDCSFVAALMIAAEHDAKWDTSLAHGPLYPKDEEGLPTWSSSSIYNVRLHFNGVYRCISIDDRIPCYADNTPMCVVGRQEDTLQIWPTLLEKAYISLRGGYDFRGSNSSIDLHALTGWIPEQIGFQHSDFQREKTWQRLKKAYDKGRLLVTAGTSRDVDKLRLPGQSHLVDSHNYAVMCLEEDEGEGWLTLMNPWETGPEREIIRMRWSEACARLDTLYLNWDPVIFAHQLQWHGIWRQDSKQSPSVELIVKQSCEVWLLLTRHTAVSSHDAMSEWISLHLFGSQEDQSSSKRGVYVDSTHTLLRSNVKSGKWKIAASRQGGNEECSFTLFAYSLSEIIWQDLAASSSSHGSTVKGQWTSKTAGGNSTQATFLHNPQYSITLKSKTNLTITVHTSKDVPVQVALVWSRGKRVAQVTQGDLVATSGIYTYGLALTEASELKAGSYTLILSTFDKGQLGSFEMQLQSDQAMQCLEIPPEGAGKYHQQIRHRWTEETAQGSPKHSGYFSNPTYEIKVDRICLFIFRLIVTAQDRPPSNVAVFSKSTRKEVISSGSYADLVCGVAIEETRLEPGTYIVVVSTYHAGSSCPFTLDMYSDRRIVYEKING